MQNSNLKLDLGCGSCKKEGTIGIDIQSQPGVDYVVNFDLEPLPLPNKSAEYIYSSHCLEHLANPVKLLQEVSRVCIDCASVEFWTPYAWENSAFIYDHKTFFNEDHYLHMCVWYVDFWKNILNSRWILKDIVYIIDSSVLIDLYSNKINLDFALKYYKGIVKEFGVFIQVCHQYQSKDLGNRNLLYVQGL